MEWYAIAMIALYGLNMGATIAMIGRPRDPISPGLALAVVIVNSLLIWGIVSLSA